MLGEQEYNQDNRDEISNNGGNSEAEAFSSSGSEYIPSENASDDNMEQNEIEEEQISEAIQEVPDTWLPVTGVSLKKFETVEIGSINIASGLSAIDIYKQIIDEHIMRIMVDETNKNAHKYRANWKNVNIAEMEKFLAIVMYMGLVKYPKISDYWSRKFLYRHCFVRHIMPRNRFQSLLRFCR